MSLYDYEVSKKISAEDPPFYALIMTAMRKGDSTNRFKLQLMWPEVYKELEDRYNAPGGLLPGDAVDGVEFDR